MKKHIMPCLFLAAIIISSCSQYYYSANTQNVAMLSKKNEVVTSFDLYAGVGTGVEIQTAYAATKHVGIQLNFGGGSGGEGSYGGGQAHGGGSYLEAGPGYFLSFGKKKRLIFETYGIFSIGGMNTTYTGANLVDVNGSIKSGMSRIAVQPSVGYKSNHFEIAFSVRAGALNYNHITTDFIPGGDKGDELQPDYLQKNKSQFFIEPALTIKAGGASVKGQLQIGTNQDVTNPHFAYSKGWASLGITFNIYKEDNKEKKIINHTKTSYIPPSL